MMPVAPDLPMLVVGTPPTAAASMAAPATAAPLMRTITPAAAPDAAFDAAFAEVRAAAGLSRATPNAQLSAAAQRHADDMLRNGYFSHTGLDGRSHIQRITAAGRTTCYPVENLAGGHGSASAALAEWRVSPGHARNLLVGGTVEYGLGRAGNIYVLTLDRVC